MFSTHIELLSVLGLDKIITLFLISLVERKIISIRSPHEKGFEIVYDTWEDATQIIDSSSFFRISFIAI